MRKWPWASIGLGILVLVLWEGYVRETRISKLVLPAPTDVMLALWKGFSSGFLQKHLVHTLMEIGLGLLLGTMIGVLLGVAMGESRMLYRLLYPYIVASQAIPKLALAPLFILWFGFDMLPKVLITALICFFPVLEATATAIRQTDALQLELFRSFGATRWQTLVHLKWRAGLPLMAAGFRMAVVMAVVGAVVGEFIGGSKGLGTLVIASQSMMDTPLMFAVLLLLTVIGTIFYQMVLFIERWLDYGR